MNEKIGTVNFGKDWFIIYEPTSITSQDVLAIIKEIQKNNKQPLIIVGTKSFKLVAQSGRLAGMVVKLSPYKKS